ncbi:MAG TPA: RsmE family RNA methyltransferase [Gemmatimonadaceae bacterium]|nr:RsmE family RNA methyltransferase [Gemmatimonadaceae bacterium]
MERSDRASVATFFVDRALIAGEVVTLGEDAAHHTRVRRISAGATIHLTNGAGTRAVAELLPPAGRGDVGARVTETETVTRPAAIHLRVPVADRDRTLWLGEKATELGITSWQSVRFRRSASVSPRGEGPAFAQKLRARMIGALEQSAGAWLPDVLPEVALDQLARDPSHSGFVLDAHGAPILSSLRGATAAIAIVLGPEGGAEPDELELLTARGWRSVRLAPTILRFETAAIAAVSIARAITLTQEP